MCVCGLVCECGVTVGGEYPFSCSLTVMDSYTSTHVHTYVHSKVQTHMVDVIWRSLSQTRYCCVVQTNSSASLVSPWFKLSPVNHLLDKRPLNLLPAGKPGPQGHSCSLYSTNVLILKHIISTVFARDTHTALGFSSH